MMQHAQPIAEKLGLVEVVRDQHHRNPNLAAKLRKLESQPSPGELIDGGERLVEQQGLGVACEGSCERDPLALSSREFGGPARLETFHVDPRQQRPCPPGAFPARQMGHRGGDVGQCIEMRKQGVMLKHQANSAPLRRGGGAAVLVEPGLPVARDFAFLRSREPCDAAKHRGLSAA